jgi:hypothetical protein
VSKVKFVYSLAFSDMGGAVAKAQGLLISREEYSKSLESFERSRICK